MRGIRKLTLYSRKVSFVKESRLDVSAPGLSQNLPTLPPGTDGDDGKHGVHGPTGMVIFLFTIYGKHRKKSTTMKTNNDSDGGGSQ